MKIGRKKTRPSALIRHLRSKGLTYAEISRLANCSQGSVSVELKLWEEEKAKGIDSKLEEQVNFLEPNSQVDHAQSDDKKVPPLPVPVVRY